VTAEEYLTSTYRPDCEYVNGHLLERNVGRKPHSHTQTFVLAWLWNRRHEFGCEPYVEQRIRVAVDRFRVPDVVVVRTPSPDEEVFTEPPYLCVEVMSPDDTMSSLQDRLDDYIGFGVANIWVIDPWKGHGWRIDTTGWHTVLDGFLRTVDGRIALPLGEVLPQAESDWPR
jgi:Uma2 family endonuclease